MTQYLWSNTDSQVAGQGTAAPPLEDAWDVPRPVVPPPQVPGQMLWLWEQQEMPLLQAVDDGGWVPYFTQGTSGTSRPDASTWANDELPTPPSVTPQEDWDVVGILGLPFKVPPPVRMAEYGWHSEERVVPGVAVFPSDDSPLPMMLVILPPLQAPIGWLYEQSDWWGGGTGTGGNVTQMQTLQSTSAYTIP